MRTADRPAVDDDMVQDQEQDVVVGAEPQQAHPEQRRTAHVEWVSRLLARLPAVPF